MRIFTHFFTIFLIAVSSIAYAQIDFSANNQVPEYDRGFRLGTNLGGRQGEWMDFELATIAAGSEELGIPGAGCNSLRLSLPNHFLERWGYDIRVNTFNDYIDELGMSELTVFLEGPSKENLDKTVYCAEKGASKMFKNLYEPIWDNGKNGTPVNENNVMALYVYKTAMKYGENVRFWEIWNEPDYTTTDKGWQPATSADNWWVRDPAPCEMTNLLAPLQHYIRALRISYEVIKFVDPDDFICIGGIGYESFLDAVLRNTDNPNGGKVTAEYPRKGGAYFDCLSYHNYPMYGAREYIGGKWVPLRHSDKAVEAFIEGKNLKEAVLKKHGYDGSKFPEKQVIVTETNVPRKSFNGYIGSEAAQYNYLAKIIIKGQAEGIGQIHTFALTDSKTATGPYNVMGFYPWLGNTQPYKQKEKLSAVATRNVMQMLEGFHFVQNRTNQLKLPDNIDGAAFVKDGEYIYALWAKTTKDNSEVASATYTFPAAWGIEGYTRYEWNYTITGKSKKAAGRTAQLSGSPTFFVLDEEVVLGIEELEEESGLLIYPNPSRGTFNIRFDDSLEKWKNGRVFDMKGNEVYSFKFKGNAREKSISLDLSPGLYIFKAWNGQESISRKIMIE